MEEFRYVGNIPTDLDGGRPIAPGDYTGPIDVSDGSPKNKHLLDDGLLIPCPSEAEREASVAKAEKIEAAEEAEVNQKPSGDTAPEEPGNDKADGKKEGETK